MLSSFTCISLSFLKLTCQRQNVDLDDTVLFVLRPDTDKRTAGQKWKVLILTITYLYDC